MAPPDAPVVRLLLVAACAVLLVRQWRRLSQRVAASKAGLVSLTRSERLAQRGLLLLAVSLGLFTVGMACLLLSRAPFEWLALVGVIVSALGVLPAVAAMVARILEGWYRGQG